MNSTSVPSSSLNSSDTPGVNFAHWFRRPQSTTLYVILSALLLGNQISLLRSAHRNSSHDISRNLEMEQQIPLSDHRLDSKGQSRKLSDLANKFWTNHSFAWRDTHRRRSHRLLPTAVDKRLDLPDYTNETLFPRNQHVRNNHTTAGGFGACLLIKDDNHLLDEWLAYHSVILPLKFLLVAIDPMSHQSPFNILKKWNNTDLTTLDMSIDLWTDANYIHERQMHKVCNQYHNLNMLKNHRRRQSVFMQRCAQHMKKRGMDWIIMTDSDEFLTFNPIANDEEKPPTKFKSSAHVVWRENLAIARSRLPPSLDSGVTVYDFLMQEADQVPWKEKKCVLLPRLLFSSVESTAQGQRALREATKEYGIDALSLNTQRFFRTPGKAKKRSSHYNRLGKPILDLSRLDIKKDLKGKFSNPHNPIKACGATNARFDESLLRVHHYLGTIDQYGARRDVRRSDEVYLQKAKQKKGVNFDIQPWLKVFVNKVGRERAQYLLKDAGKVLDEDPFDLCDGNFDGEGKPVPWVPHYLSAALEKLKKQGRLAKHIQ